ELLSNEYDIETIWDESWKGGERVSVNYLNENNFHTIFFFQILPPLDYLKTLNCKNLVWFPMYDQEGGKHYTSYIPYLDLNLKIFSFSKKLYENLKKAGLNCYYYKYHLKPVDTLSTDNNSKRVFFWVRTSQVTWNIVKKLLGGNDIEKVIMKLTPDPNHKIDIPSKEDIDKYNIQLIERWLDKMSFIEALSRGMCVIAPDNATMNEYIIHGKNGLLYDLKNPEELNLGNLPNMCENAIKIAKQDYESWKKSKPEILIDLTKPDKKLTPIKLLYLKAAYTHSLIYPELTSIILFPLVKLKTILKTCLKAFYS
ncbi:MAG: hypothetical protein CVT88_10560, partial [Candidatus Altiarchaeales archaeon HGW-Altiarchaeales-1]